MKTTNAEILLKTLEEEERGRALPNPSAIIEAVRAILNARAPGFAKMNEGACREDCLHCRTARAKGAYTCLQCGYEGAPMIYGCSCVTRGERSEPCAGPSTVDGCGHGARSCPVCLEASDNAADENFDPMVMIRAIREKINEWPEPMRPAYYNPNNRVDVGIYAAEDAIQLLRVAEAMVYQSVTDLQALAEGNRPRKKRSGS